MKQRTDKSRRKFFGLMAAAATMPFMGARKEDAVGKKDIKGKMICMSGSNVGISTSTPNMRIDIVSNKGRSH